MRKLVLLTAAVVAATMTFAPSGLAAPTAPAAPDVVLVNQPVHSMCSGQRFTVGVWYQSFSGGSRAYRISIWGPRHTRIFYRHGLASAKHWQFWKVKAGRRGQYRVVYSGHRPGSSKWTNFGVIIHAQRCSRR